MAKKEAKRVALEDWLQDNANWGMEPPQEFIDNWTKVFKDRADYACEPVWKDLWFLHNWVKTRKPRTILEFGSGCSTVIMAHALWHNRKGWIDSVEESIGWTLETKKIMPFYLSTISTVYYCPVSEAMYGEEYVLRYRPSYPTKPDFIYLDGPASENKYRITINPLELEASFSKGFSMIIDARATTVAFYIDNFQRHYKWACIKGVDNGIAIFELLE